ncbi:hypothetical protein OE810_08885, partial [Rhodobacteraceae bacterium XHP0102]|nr:hypothetical protein [Rhodobacteraceae bacterium XHP0102]
ILSGASNIATDDPAAVSLDIADAETLLVTLGATITNGYDIDDSADNILSEQSAGDTNGILSGASNIATDDPAAVSLDIADAETLLVTLGATITNGYDIDDTAPHIQAVIDADDPNGILAGATSIATNDAGSLDVPVSLASKVTTAYSIEDTLENIQNELSNNPETDVFDNATGTNADTPDPTTDPETAARLSVDEVNALRAANVTVTNGYVLVISEDTTLTAPFAFQTSGTVGVETDPVAPTGSFELNVVGVTVPGDLELTSSVSLVLTAAQADSYTVAGGDDVRITSGTATTLYDFGDIDGANRLTIDYLTGGVLNGATDLNGADIVIAPGQTLTLTAAQADGQTIRGPGSVTVTDFTGSDAVDLSDVDVSGTVTLDRVDPAAAQMNEITLTSTDGNYVLSGDAGTGSNFTLKLSTDGSVGGHVVGGFAAGDTADAYDVLDFSAFVGAIPDLVVVTNGFSDPIADNSIVLFEIGVAGGAEAIESAFALSGVNSTFLQTTNPDTSVNSLLASSSNMIFAMDNRNTDGEVSFWLWEDDAGNDDGDVQASELTELITLTDVSVQDLSTLNILHDPGPV